MAPSQDLVGMRQCLQHKFHVPLAQLPFDEDSFLLQQIKEKKANDDRLKALKKKAKHRAGGPTAKKKVNETLSDMNFSLTISSATNGAEVFTLKSEKEEVIELSLEDQKSSVIEMPKVPRMNPAALP